MISLSKPDITRHEIRAVLDVLKSGIVASGPRVKQLEHNAAVFLGVPHCIAVSSGTTALHAALLALGIGKGDVVITTPFSFIATSNSILFCNATPLFCDIDPTTFNLDPNLVEQALKKNKRVKAIMVVHLYGNPCDMDAFTFLAKKYRIHLVEDCAQSIGATFRGKQTGSFGDTGCFSLYATKNLMMVEGGLITTPHPRIDTACRALINHGRSGRFTHATLGYNFRTTDVCAALGIEQLKRIGEITEKRAVHAAYYSKHLKHIDWLTLPTVQSNATHVFHQYTVHVPQSIRDRFVEHLHSLDIHAAAIYPFTIPEQPLYKKMGYKPQPIARDISRQVVCIPVHSRLSNNDCACVVDAIKRFVP